MAAAKSTSAAPRLDTATVVRAAVRITREQGLGAVSMRVIADRLNVTPMALYYYVETKELLVTLVADAVVGKVKLSLPNDDWRSELVRSMEDYRRTIGRYPGVAAILLQGGLLPCARRLVANQIDVLESAGFTPGDARRGYAAYQLLVLGRLAVDEAQRSNPPRSPTHVRETGTDAYLAELHGEAAFRDAVGALLDAFAVRLGPST
jgi:AcrR family transcriptional regulator